VGEIPQVLIVSSDPAHCAKLGEIVGRLGMQSAACAALADARAHIDAQGFQIVLCSDELPDCNLRMAVPVLANATGGVPVIVVSHLAEWDAYLRALDAGAFDYLVCPPDPEEAERVLQLALGQHPPLGRASGTAA
jgi:DNA-binding NtrC family response regulator